jgi:hypothetical protein
MKHFEHPKESARKRAERKWHNNDLRRRYKEAKQANAAELEPPKTTVVTVVNPHFDEQKEFQERVERSRRAFIRRLRALVNEGREQGIKKYKLSIEAKKRMLLGAKYKLLLARQREREQLEAQQRSNDLFA